MTTHAAHADASRAIQEIHHAYNGRPDIPTPHHNSETAPRPGKRITAKTEIPNHQTTVTTPRN
jgi:hypothetical protein